MKVIDMVKVGYGSPASLLAQQVNQEINYVSEWTSKVASARITLAAHKAKLRQYAKAFQRIKGL